MKFIDAVTFLNTQPMFRNPLPKERFRFLSAAQFNKLVANGTLKTKQSETASAATNWKFVPVTLYYVEN